MCAKTAKKAKGVTPPRPADIKRESAEVPLSRIRIPEENPARLSCDPATIENYKVIIAEYITERKKHKGPDPAPKFPFPPPKVKRIEADEDGRDLEVLCGCHTLTAAAEAELESIEVEICDGSDRDLLIESIRDNAIHGLRYSHDDLRHNIRHLKQACPNMTIRDIAQVVGCGKSTVGKVLNGKEDPEEDKSGGRKSGTSLRPYDGKRFVANLLRMVERNIDDYADADMIALAKLSGRIIKMLEEKRPEMRDRYHESLQAVVDPESMELIDYEGDTLYVEEKEGEHGTQE